MPRITLKADCHPTEDPSKVRDALLNIFPDAEIEEVERGLIARSTSIERFREIIWNLKILDTARSVMRGSMREGRTRFAINKQVACVGKVSFVEEHMPLGSIQVVIEDPHLEALIDYIAPTTERGEVVG